MMSFGVLMWHTHLARSVSITRSAITPHSPHNAATLVQVAYMISGMVYFMWSLHCGFIIPEPSYPGWWIWLYYINPMSWILYGFVASQLGDVTSTFVQVKRLGCYRPMLQP